jgi:AAA domain, putative AbiEii toxin, Type IV TA system
LTRIFSGIQELVPQLRQFEDATPTNAPTLEFGKGVSRFNFDVLSHGEKQVVITLLNFVVRKAFLKDKIIFIDELDAHMHTALQKGLIEELVKHWVEDTAQLWVASHSLGFIEFAQSDPNSVIVDFDEFDFDLPQVLGPSSKSDSNLFNTAISSETLKLLASGKQIVFVENQDLELVDSILSTPQRVVVAATNRDAAIQRAQSFPGGLCLIDKDYVLSAERAELMIRDPQLRMLELYSIENYLFHPSNIAEFVAQRSLTLNDKEYRDAWTKEGGKVVESLANGKGVSGVRNSYPFYKETDPQSLTSRKRFIEMNGSEITSALTSGDFDRAFEFIPAKQYGAIAKKLIGAYQRGELSQTTWFKSKIKALFDQ